MQLVPSLTAFTNAGGKREEREGSKECRWEGGPREGGGVESIHSDHIDGLKADGEAEVVEEGTHSGPLEPLYEKVRVLVLLRPLALVGEPSALRVEAS